MLNDPIFRSRNNVLYKKVDDTVYELTRNIFRQYIWILINDDLPPGCTETTLRSEGFKVVGDAIIVKDEPSVAIMGTAEDFIVHESGGFSMAENANDGFVSSTHDAVRHFANWVPENAQQRRFKAMVVDLEAKAMGEEDEHTFATGSATGDFKNPI